MNINPSNMSDPPPDPPHQPDHPMPPAPRSVLPDSPVDPPLPPHDKPGGGDSAAKSVNFVGDVPLPSQSQSSQPILPTVAVPSPPAILTNPEAEDCQHLSKKKQLAVHPRSRRLGRRRSQMTLMSHLSILPEMNLHLHPITIRTIQQTCRYNMKVRKN